MSKVTGLKARPGFIERCFHSFAPAECPYEECGYRDALDEIERLKAELATAQEDTARLDWLTENPSSVGYAQGYGSTVSGWAYRMHGDFWVAPDPRAAIDAARKESR